MKAILVNDDQSLRWDNVPDPIAKPEDVLVKIEYAALNRADLMQREVDYPPPEGCPDWMGLKVSGEIVEIGDTAKEKSNWKLGDKVCALLGGGGYAEYVNVKYDMFMPVPENCSMIEAAAIPEAFATAYLNLFHEGKIKEDNRILREIKKRIKKLTEAVKRTLPAVAETLEKLRSTMIHCRYVIILRIGGKPPRQQKPQGWKFIVMIILQLLPN